MRALRLIVLAGVLVLALSAVVREATASPQLGTSTSCAAYGTTNACRSKTVQNVSSSTWNAGVWSYTKNPQTNIGVIGWSWWTVREWRSGVITYEYYGGASTRTNTYTHQANGNHSKHSCSLTRTGYSMGNHDFHQSGYTHIYPYKEYSEVLW